MPQTRQRVYTVIVKKELVNVAFLEHIFHKVLPEKILPAFLELGKYSVGHIRKSVKRVLDDLCLMPSLPDPCKDSWGSAEI